MQQGNTNNSSDASANAEISFDEFTAATYAEWRQAAEAALKGADFEKSLVKKVIEGFSTQPIYRAEDINAREESLPGEFPYRRGTRGLGYQEKAWEVTQSIAARTPQEFNKRATYDLQRGQTALNIALGCKCGGLALREASGWSEAFKDIAIDKIPVYINPGSNGTAVLGFWVNEFKTRGLCPSQMTGGILYDPLSRLAGKGKLNSSLGNAYDQMAEMVKWSEDKAPGMKTIGVSGIPYHDSGADAIQEIAIILSTAVEYLREMEKRGLSADQVAPRIRVSVGLGANLFLEIAKLRALRQLWASLIQACGGSQVSSRIDLHGRTSAWTTSKVDPWVNILRGTSQAFSAVIGGVDSLDILPFDHAVRPSDDFSRRLARNTQLILQGECNLDKVVDPAGGSWYIEKMTDTLARDAWTMFQEIEKEGGLSASLLSGNIQKKINDKAAKRYELIDQRRQNLVGANRYTNLDEKPLEPVNLQEPADFSPKQVDLSSCDKTVCCAARAASEGACLHQLADAISGDETVSAEALPKRHATERFERLLDKATVYMTQHGKRPTIFFANMGPLRQHKARADFSQDFLRAGGFDCFYPSGFNTPEEAAKAAADSGMSACVICSTDDTYPDIVPAFCAALKAAKPDMKIGLAGYPAEHVEAFKAAGVDFFIHVRANCYETLNSLQANIGL